MYIISMPLLLLDKTAKIIIWKQQASNLRDINQIPVKCVVRNSATLNSHYWLIQK